MKMKNQRVFMAKESTGTMNSVQLRNIFPKDTGYTNVSFGDRNHLCM